MDIPWSEKLKEEMRIVKINAERNSFLLCGTCLKIIDENQMLWFFFKQCGMEPKLTNHKTDHIYWWQLASNSKLKCDCCKTIFSDYDEVHFVNVVGSEKKSDLMICDYCYNYRFTKGEP